MKNNKVTSHKIESYIIYEVSVFDGLSFVHNTYFSHTRCRVRRKTKIMQLTFTMTFTMTVSSSALLWRFHDSSLVIFSYK